MMPGTMPMRPPGQTGRGGTAMRGGPMGRGDYGKQLPIQKLYFFSTHWHPMPLTYVLLMRNHGP